MSLICICQGREKSTPKTDGFNFLFVIYLCIL